MLKCTIVTTRCLSVVNFSQFRLFLRNRWTEFNETSKESSTQSPLPSLCFSGRSENGNCRPDLWLAQIFWTSSLQPDDNRIKRNLTGSKISASSFKFPFFGPIPNLIGRDFNDWIEFNKTRQESRSKYPLASLCYSQFWPIGKPRWPPWPLMVLSIFDFFSTMAEQNLTKLDRKQDTIFLCHVCVCFFFSI